MTDWDNPVWRPKTTEQRLVEKTDWVIRQDGAVWWVALPDGGLVTAPCGSRDEAIEEALWQLKRREERGQM